MCRESPVEAKVFNPNIGKLDPKTVSCHFIGYPEKSKGFCFYCPDRHTKFVETRHAIFLEDEMVRGSMVAQEIDLEEKWVYVPTPMIQEPVFSLPVATAPTIPDIVVPTPVVSSPAIETNDNDEPVLQDPTELVATDEGEPQQPQDDNVPQVEVQNVPEAEAPRRSQRVEGQLFLATIKFIIQKSLIWRVIPLHMKKP